MAEPLQRQRQELINFAALYFMWNLIRRSRHLRAERPMPGFQASNVADRTLWGGNGVGVHAREVSRARSFI